MTGVEEVEDRREGRGGNGTGNLTVAVTQEEVGRRMAPSQQSSGKQWSRLMIHSLIVMALTERMGKSIPRKCMSTSCESW